MYAPNFVCLLTNTRQCERVSLQDPTEFLDEEDEWPG
jgi:hypothetical protein